TDKIDDKLTESLMRTNKANMSDYQPATVLIDTVRNDKADQTTKQASNTSPLKGNNTQRKRRVRKSSNANKAPAQSYDISSEEDFPSLSSHKTTSENSSKNSSVTQENVGGQRVSEKSISNPERSAGVQKCTPESKPNAKKVKTQRATRKPDDMSTDSSDE